MKTCIIRDSNCNQIQSNCFASYCTAGQGNVYACQYGDPANWFRVVRMDSFHWKSKNRMCQIREETWARHELLPMFLFRRKKRQLCIFSTIIVMHTFFAEFDFKMLYFFSKIKYRLKTKTNFRFLKGNYAIRYEHLTVLWKHHGFVYLRVWRRKVQWITAWYQVSFQSEILEVIQWAECLFWYINELAIAQIQMSQHFQVFECVCTTNKLNRILV